jgi:serine/threonine protein phosphatase PrpC
VRASTSQRGHPKYGTDPAHLNVATTSGELRPTRMQLLLCSDGLTEEVDDRGIARTVSTMPARRNAWTRWSPPCSTAVAATTSA